MALRIMKKKIVLTILLVLLFILAFSCISFAAAYDPVKATITYSPKTVNDLINMQISITITNVGDGDMTDPVTLYYPNGKKVSDFGEDGSVKLSVGSSKTYSGSWQLRQSDLDKGEIKYFIRYSMLNSKGEKETKTKYLSAKFEYVNAVTDVQINRTISPSVAKAGQEVTVTYNFVNNGTVSITKIRVQENKSIAAKPQSLDELKPGEENSIVFKFKMGKKNLTSSSKVSYKAENEAKSKSFEAQTISFGESKVKATLISDKKGVIIGDTVKLLLTLENKGTLDYNSIDVNDPALGDVFTGEPLLAGKKVTLEKELVINEPSTYQFTISGTDTTGDQLTLKTDKLEIKCIDETQKLSLNVSLASDTNTVYTNSGKIRFTVTVNNNSLGDAKKVKISHGGIPIYTFDSIAPGQTKSVTRDYMLSMAGKYQFVASCIDVLGEKLDFPSNEIYVDLISPTMVPVSVTPTSLPALVTIAPKTWDEAPESFEKTGRIFNTLTIIFAILTALVLGLLAYAYIFKFISKYKSKKAVANLEIKQGRNYLQKAENTNVAADVPTEINISDEWKNPEYKGYSSEKDELPEIEAPFADEELVEDTEEAVQNNDTPPTYRRRSPSDKI